MDGATATALITLAVMGVLVFLAFGLLATFLLLAGFGLTLAYGLYREANRERRKD